MSTNPDSSGGPAANNGTPTTSPRISIVMPSFNQARFLREALDSVLSQDYPGLELLVVDGGSTDGSVDILREYEKHLAWWVSEKDEGQADAINKGFAKATGELYGWLNSDDYFLPGALQLAAEAYRRNPEAGLFPGNGLRVDERGRTIARFAQVPIHVKHDALALGIDYLLQPCTFFSAKAWKHVGGLRKHLHWTLDWDLWIRIAKEFAGESIDDQVAASREYGDTKTSTGAFERWWEIRNLAREHTGVEMTPGALAYFCDTLCTYLREDRDALRLLPGLALPTARYWSDVSHTGLVRLTGRTDGFPGIEEPHIEDALQRNHSAAEEASSRRTEVEVRKRDIQHLLGMLRERFNRGGDLQPVAGEADVGTLLDQLEQMAVETCETLGAREDENVDLRSRYYEAVSQLEFHADRIRRVEGTLFFRAGRTLRLC